MSLLSLADLQIFKRSPVPEDYPVTLMPTFYSPVDDVQGVLLALIESARESLVIAMYSLTDETLAGAVLDKMADPNADVMVVLDSSQASGVHEARLLEAASLPRNVLTRGQSERGAIMHLKMMVVDNLDVAMGSANWTFSGHTYQDNQVTVIRNRCLAAEATERIATIRQHMLSA